MMFDPKIKNLAWFVLVLAVLLGGCDGRDWKAARKQNTLQAYQEYLRKRPDGKFAPTATRVVDRMSYTRATDLYTISAFKEYLQQHPEGDYVRQAQGYLESIARNRVNALTPEQLAKLKVVVETSQGTFRLELFPDQAPGHCRNLVYLAILQFYDKQLINLIRKDQFIRFGDPKNNGMGGPGYMIPAELNDLSHERGMVSMWHLPDQPDSAGSQLVVFLKSFPEFDGKYTVFARVAEGLELVEAIAAAPLREENGRPSAEPRDPIVIKSLRVDGFNPD